MFLKKSLIGVCLIFYSAFGYCDFLCSGHTVSVKLPPVLYPGVTYSLGDLFSCRNTNDLYGSYIYPEQRTTSDLYINPSFKAAGVAIGYYRLSDWTENNVISNHNPPIANIFWYGEAHALFDDFQITMPKSIKPFSLKAGENLVRLKLVAKQSDFRYPNHPSHYYIGDLNSFEVYINAQSDSKGVSCDYSKSNVAVKLPAVNKSTFSKIGVVAANTQFNLGYSCSDAVISSVQLDGTADVTAGNTVLASQTGTGYASGVGIQFVDDKGAVIELGKPYPFSSSSLIANKKFSARYYQTQSAVTPGLVKGTATVTYTFQ
ncbi:type 1 fimbrial protein [Deefgea tanakiae]|uniref:Type 1 fimbrial protein n=1 Tax=Deefgea tanakiae TaxID=2865840 RepID=A0ABX8Z8K5_9NEIS|nr:fimbrial protein [Deefgea tanakiae]QZA78921.1 type 1 fimbrial protein [Deefgea tanakiae]